MKLTMHDNGFTVTGKKGILLREDPSHPLIFTGHGEDDIRIRSGFSTVKDYVTERIPLKLLSIHPMEEEELRTAADAEEDTIVGPKKPNGPVTEGCLAEYSDGNDFRLQLELLLSEDSCTINFRPSEPDETAPSMNRLWFRIAAEKEEGVYGGGEQFSYLNMRGRHFPLWTSEPGVGRDKTTKITWLSDKESGNGGDYYGTYFPQQTYISSRDYYFHTFCTAYADFDFRHADFHELQFWAIPKRFYFREADSLADTVRALSDLLGKQMLLPDFVYNGAILGLQGGTKRVQELTERSRKHGIPVAGLFCQDWCGNYMDPTFGKRLRWDFRWDPTLYPDLPDAMKQWEKDGIRYLGYINPYLVAGGKLYNDGKKAGALLLNKDGEVYQMNSGTIYFGMVDLSTERGFNWYKEVIKKELLAFGLSGWMADFGEYVPPDCCPASGEDPKIWHNRYPAEWSRCNYEACKEAGKEGQIMYFMRSGATGSQKYTALQWQGDQSVDWTRHDGMPSAITGALSLMMSGYGLSHSDIGGYTSLFGNDRTKELFMRWAEFAAFTPVMRTHEGNKPEENFQYYDDEECMDHFGRMVRIHLALVPYIRDLVQENHETGLGCMRPLFIHYESDPETRDIQDEYLLGQDLLVAPILEEGAEKRSVYLPEDEWIGLFDGEQYKPGTIEASAPMGKPAVFYRAKSPYRELFDGIRSVK